MLETTLLRRRPRMPGGGGVPIADETEKARLCASVAENSTERR